MHATGVFSMLLDAYLDPGVNVILLRGGTRSSKTFSSMQLLNLLAAKAKKRTLISVVSESMPHLKKGAMRDFENMLTDDGVYDHSKWNATDKLYRYDKGTLEFFSADQPGKVHGPARDILYINECINIPYETARQLFIRTSGKKICDYNPAFEFWADSKLMPRKDVRVIDSTYRDNDMLTASQIAEIESNREIDPEWWDIYGEGKIGTGQGLVVKNWDIVDDLPPKSEWKDAWIGVDFGWSAPTAIMLMVLSQGEIYIDQLGYSPNMSNKKIADTIKDAGYARLETICDGAEPKSIAELEAHGVRAITTENKDIKLGIDIMNRYKKHYTKRSLESIDENRKYRYPQLIEGGYGDIPIKKNGHAKDAERYVFLNRLSDSNSSFSVTSGKAKRRNK